ncbi:MAG: RluA family pseudouridine synthase [Desulfovibrionales bacterium]|nr:RluA family pseudouridine synthase [Desulfovibrionales bacterium]
MSKSYKYPQDEQPMRLDRIVATLLAVGLRASRTYIDQGQVLVDGRLVAKGILVQPGQIVTVSEAPKSKAGAGLANIIHQNTQHAAIFKPKAMHSVLGKDHNCVQEELSLLGLAGWQLVNRLDYLTSGLVLAAATEQDVLYYKALQDKGEVAKYYLALVHGVVLSAFTVHQRIDDTQRRRVRVLTDPDDPVRSTFVQPITVLDSTTLVLARIYKGRRHQIRAHLAHAGYPLVGDPLYGSGPESDFFLHHCLLDMPGFQAWTLPQKSHFVDLAYPYLSKIIVEVV